ncbi:MAG: lamin tail domain-containing protein [Patescibacteria group bacterium]
MRLSLLIFIIGALLFLSGSYFWVTNLEKSGGSVLNSSVSNFRSAALETFQSKRLVAEIPLGETGENKNLFARPTTASISSNSDAAQEKCVFESAGLAVRSPIIFSEIAWMGDLEDSANEWIEIVNASENPVSIKGFEVIDKDEQIKVVLPDVSLGAGEYYVLSRNSDMSESRLTYEGNLRNSDETLKLFNSDCVFLDEAPAAPSWPAGSVKTKATMERNTSDLSWYSSALPGGTPGEKNSIPPVNTPSPNSTPPTPAPTASSSIAPLPNTNEPVNLPPPASNIETPQSQNGKILISEIMVGIDGNSSYEFIELYNPNSSIVDLTGWSIKKRNSNNNEEPLVSAAYFKDKTIPPQKHLLLANTSSSINSADVLWPKSYTLAYSNNSVILYNANGERVEEVSWSEIPKGQSFERATWTSPDFGIQSLPNPQNSLQ